MASNLCITAVQLQICLCRASLLTPARPCTPATAAHKRTLNAVGDVTKQAWRLQPLPHSPSPWGESWQGWESRLIHCLPGVIHRCSFN